MPPERRIQREVLRILSAPINIKYEVIIVGFGWIVKMCSA